MDAWAMNPRDGTGMVRAPAKVFEVGPGHIAITVNVSPTEAALLHLTRNELLGLLEKIDNWGPPNNPVAP